MAQRLVPVAMALLSLTIPHQTKADTNLQPNLKLTVADQVQTFWIAQKLDHFNATELRTWKMRYMLDSSLYKAGGPLFIHIGGEWEIAREDIAGGHLYDMAREHNALLAYIEHRFYGQSQPLPDLSIESLQFLNAKQALADLAHFIRSIKQQTTGLAAAKVILMGGSYAGSLVVWFKRIYAELAAGGWASSAPLYAKLNFVEYKELTATCIKLAAGDDCYKRIEQGFAEMQKMFATKRGAELKTMLQLCKHFDVDNALNVWNLWNEIADLFAEVVQSHNAEKLQVIFSRMRLSSNALFGVSSYVVKFLSLKYSNETCYDLSYDTHIKALSKTSYDAKGLRQWMFQQCNEFGWFPSTATTTQPMGIQLPLAFFTRVCTDVFGTKYTQEFIQKQVEQTNAYFGGLQPAVQHVYLTHGQLDAWRAVGIQQANQATVIPGYAHCKDFAAISDSDSREMRESKQRIAKLLRAWLS